MHKIRRGRWWPPPLILKINILSDFFYKYRLGLLVLSNKLTIGLFPVWVCGDQPQGYIFIFCCDQAALRTLISVCPSVCPSVTPFWQCSCHLIILKFSGVITTDKRDVHAKGQGQRSKVKVTEVMTPFSRFRTITLVWIHIWRWNDAQSLMLLRRGALFFSRSCVNFQGHAGPKIADFDPNWVFPDCNSSLNIPMDWKCCKKLNVV